MEKQTTTKIIVDSITHSRKDELAQLLDILAQIRREMVTSSQSQG